MKSILRQVRTVSSIMAAAVVLAVPSQMFAQEKAQVDKPTFEDLPSPEVNVGKSKSFRAKDWLEVEAKIKIAKPRGSKELFADQITVKWYVAVKNPDGKGVYLLTKDVTHINVPLDEDIYVSVYLSPSSIKRITGQDRAGKNSVECVGLEVQRGGTKLGENSTKGELASWINAPSLSRTDKFPLLSKNETPYSMLWWDRYAEIQEKP
jgi:hypothetical protein